MFTLSLCRDVGKMHEWSYDTFNRTHQNVNCSQKNKANFYTFKSRWKPDKKKYSGKYQSKPRRKIPYLKKHNYPSKKVICYNCQNPCHWENECPQKKNKLKLSSLFTKYLELEGWDFCFFFPTNKPLGEIYYLDLSKLSDIDFTLEYDDSSEEFSDSDYIYSIWSTKIEVR